MDDASYMKKALLLAEKAYRLDEVPIGALVVASDGTVLGSGYNLTEQSCAQSKHAEVQAIEQAGKQLGTWRLEGCTLYVTLEPCLMCMSLVCLSRVERLVYGAESPLFGYHVDKEAMPQIYRKHLKGITSGILEKESQKLLEQFFTSKRKQ